MPRGAAIAVAVLLAGSGGVVPIHASAPPTDGAFRSQEVYSRDWKRLRSDNFVAVGNADFNAMRGVLLELEGFRAALLRSLPSLRVTAAVPTTIVVFKDDAAFSRFKPRDSAGRRRDSVAGYLLSGPAGSYLTVAMHRERGRTFQYLFHEYTHFIVRQNMGDVPMWLNEGLAEFHSTFRATPVEGRSVLGDPPSSRLTRIQRGPLLPLRDILTAADGVALEGDAERASAFYAQSWALVHFLMLGESGTHRAQIAAYLSAMAAGQPVPAAVSAAFGMSIDALEAAVVRHARQASVPRVTLEEPRTGVRIRTTLEAMPEREVTALHQSLLTLLDRATPHR
jgi:hypothetical protein